MNTPRITSREDVDRIENTLLPLVLDQEHNVFDDTEDLRAMADLARVALPAESGTNPLDTPETREVVTIAFTHAHRLLAKNATVREDAIMGATWDAVLVTLAPRVAALRLAAWREGVGAAAGVCERLEDGAVQGIVQEVARECAGLVRALPPPAAFASPGPDADALRAAFHRGREAGRDDAVQACQRYVAREREARDEAHERCDDEEEADCARAVHVAEGIAAYIEMLGPVEDADEPAAVGPDGWCDIATAPRDGTPFLAALSGGDVVILYAPGSLSARSRYLWWRGSGGNGMRVPVEETHPPGTVFDERVTHWMPIPPVPEVPHADPQ